MAHFLTDTHLNTSIALGLLVYAIAILLPMVPAIVVFRLFPETKVSASGKLSQISFKAGGAFGAYIVVAVLGYLMVQRVLNIIDPPNPIPCQACMECKPLSEWTVSGIVQFEDSDHNAVADAMTLQKMTVATLSPASITMSDNIIQFTLPSDSTKWNSILLKLDAPGRVSTTMRFLDLRNRAKLDNSTHQITLADTLRIFARLNDAPKYTQLQAPIVIDTSKSTAYDY
jgi:hypothetical protein